MLLDGYCIFIWNHNEQSNPISVWMYTSMGLVSNCFFHNMEGGRRGTRRQRGVGLAEEQLAVEEEQSRVSLTERRKKAGFRACRGWKGATQRRSTPGWRELRSGARPFSWAEGTVRRRSIRLCSP
jgi:hypothetical protein